MSSGVGSNSDNSSGGSYACRSPNVALNGMGKSVGMDMKGKGVVAVLMSLRYVETRMGTLGKTDVGGCERGGGGVNVGESAYREGDRKCWRFWHREEWKCLVRGIVSQECSDDYFSGRRSPS